MRSPKAILNFNGQNATSTLNNWLNSVSYTDVLDGESPEVRIDLNDPDGRWQGSWFPEKGDRVEISFSYEGENTRLNAWTFEIDDPEISGGTQGRKVNFGAQATPLSTDLRQKRTKAYEKVTLAAIVADIAGRQGLEVIGEIPDVDFNRLTQNEESDLEFLKRASKDWGVLFKVEGDRLIFYSWEELNNKPSTFVLPEESIKKYRIRKQTSNTYKRCEVRHAKGDDKKTVIAIVEADPMPDSDDVLILSAKVESVRQAELKAKEALRQKNSKEWRGQFSLEGSPNLVAGVNFELALSEGNKANGKWQIVKASHRVDRQGWICDIECEKR